MVLIQGNISKWMKKVGDSIKPGDILAQIETDKATVDFEMQEEGFVAKLLYPEGTKDIKLGQVVAIVVENKEDIAKFQDYQATAAAAPVAAPVAAKKQEAAAPQQATQAKTTTAAAPQTLGERVFVSPLAKKIATEGGLDLSGVTGSGPNNRILKSDVEEALLSAK